jgi:uncharacterized protein YjiS (DUF1127 family)
MESTDDSSAAPDLPAAGASPPASRRRLYARLRGGIAAWRARARGRRLLAQLDEHMLRDIGIDPARVWQETGKWFWQP